MKNILFLLCVIVFSANSMQAQQNDPKAKQILDKVSKQFKSYSSIIADFTYEIDNASGANISTNFGKVYMKNTNYHVTLGNNEIFCNGSTIWSLDKNYDEVNVSNVDKSNNSLSPQKLFTNFYDKDFLYKLNGITKIKVKEMVGGKVTSRQISNLAEIELTPKDKSMPFFKVYVYVDKVKDQIVKVKLYEKGGNRYVYSISSFNTNQTISNDLFTFNKAKYPKVEVIDLR